MMTKLKNNKSILKTLNILLEIVIIFSMYWTAVWLRMILPFGTYFHVFDSVQYMVLAIVFTLVIILVTYLSGAYFTFHIESITKEIIKVATSTFYGIASDCVLIYLFRLEQFSRVLLGYFTVLAFVAILIKRIIFNKLVNYYDRKYNVANNVVMIGAGRTAKLVYQTVLKQHYKNMNLVGYLGDYENKYIPAYLGKVTEIRNVLSDHDIEMILIAEPEFTRDDIKEMVVLATHHNIRICVIPEFSEFMPSKDAVMVMEGNYLCELTALDTCEIMGVNISVTNMEKTFNKIKDNLSEWSGKYICVSNVHTTVTASEDAKYKSIQNKAVISLPDGGPLSKYSREQGYSGASRVTGPDLMQRVLRESAENGWKHYFYGSTQETLDKLKNVIEERYPGVEICGMTSPPFRPLTVQEDAEIVKTINEANPDFVWVGLGAPKQEVWMAAHEDRVKGLMIGVGAAFDYECGNIKRAPMWMQKANLEWFYRLMQDPKRLFSRYIRTNTKYLIWKYQNGGKR